MFADIRRALEPGQGFASSVWRIVWLNGALMQADTATHGKVGTSMVLALIGAGPYSLFVIFAGLYGMALSSYPRAFGVPWNSDLRPNFPDGGESFWLSLLVLLVGISMIACLVFAARSSRTARWLTIGWLLAAIAVAQRFARRPDASRRCFLDGYSDTVVCASGRTVALRDFVLLALPALVAIAALSWGSWRAARQIGRRSPRAPGRSGGRGQRVSSPSA